MTRLVVTRDAPNEVRLKLLTWPPPMWPPPWKPPPPPPPRAEASVRVDMPSAATAAMARMNLRDMAFSPGFGFDWRRGLTSHPGNWSHRPPERFMGPGG